MCVTGKFNVAIVAPLLIFTAFGIKPVYSSQDTSSSNRASVVRQIEAAALEQGARVALRRLNTALSRNPHYRADLLFLKGLLEIEDGQSQNAIRTFTQIISDYPDLLGAYNNLAKLYVESGQLSKAKEILEKGIKSNPDFAVTYHNLNSIQGLMAGVAMQRALNMPIRQIPPVEIQKVTSVNGLSFFDPITLVAKVETPIQATVESPEVTLEESNPIEPQQIQTFLNEWATAWSDGSVEDYLAKYGDSFIPPSGLTRTQWENQRRQRINPSLNIQVKLENIDIKNSGDVIIATFLQHYTSNSFRGRTNKRLELIEKNGSWRIVQEQTGR